LGLYFTLFDSSDAETACTQDILFNKPNIRLLKNSISKWLNKIGIKGRHVQIFIFCKCTRNEYAKQSQEQMFSPYKE
jgi:hypothetical protein